MAIDSWKRVCIGDLCEGIYDGPHATPKKTMAGPVFLGISCLSNGRIDTTGSAHLSEEDFIRWTRRITPRANDIVFSYETRLGEAGLIPRGLKCCLGRRMALMRPDEEKVAPRFLLYAFLAPEFQQTLRAYTVHGSTVDRIPLIEFPRFPIRVPPLREQKAIAHILGTLDDKIELHRRMNGTLESLARALFRSWFVDFDPVRAKAAGRRPHAMTKEIARLFPNAFQPSTIGPIPKGWKVGTISDISEINAWTLAKNDPLATIEYVEISQVHCGNVDATSLYRRGDEPSRARRRLRHGDTVLSTVRPERQAYFLCLHPPENLVASTGFAVLTPHPGRWAFLHSALSLPTVFEYLGLMADGGAYPAVRPDVIAEYPVVLPPGELIDEYQRICAPFYERAAMSRAESRTLASLRDTLLPKLLSGQLRVSGAAGVLEGGGRAGTDTDGCREGV